MKKKYDKNYYNNILKIKITDKKYIYNTKINTKFYLLK